MASTAELVVQGIIAVGGTGVLAAVANAFMSRSKSKAEMEQGRADAAKVLAEGAAVLVEPLRTEVNLLHEQVNRMRTREDKLYRLMRRHSEWDTVVAAQLRAGGATIDEPPPLYIGEDGVAS